MLEDERALDQFRADIRCLDKIEAMIGKPNIFDVLGIARTEIRHSNILRWLLDPNGSHGLGSLFLGAFLQDLGKLGADTVKLLNDKHKLNSFYVLKEYKHIDILLVSKDPKSKIVIAIENKVDSGEHDNQLVRYKHTVDADFPGFYRELVYLTPDGSRASEKDWRALGYETVYNALKSCLGKVDFENENKQIGPEARFLLEQYLQLLEREFVMDKTELSEKCNEIYREHKRALDLIFELREDNCGDTFQMIKAWFRQHRESGFVCDEEHSNKSYVRFSSDWLEGCAPKLQDGLKSRWGSAYSAYYEVVNRKNGLSCKVTASSENMSHETFESIKTVFGLSASDFPAGWKFKTIYSFGKKLRLNDDMEESFDEKQIDKYMCALLDEIRTFEKEKCRK